MCISSSDYVFAAIIKQKVSSDGIVTYYVSNEEERMLAFNSMFARMEGKGKIVYTNKYIGNTDNLYDYIEYRYIYQNKVRGAYSGIGNFTGTGYYKDNNTFTYEFYYYEEPDQTKYVYDKIHQAIRDNMDKLNSDYEKAYFAYNWVLDNTKTDYTMSNYSTYTGRAGDGTICQGYSTLYAAIATELGLDCHIIFGGVNGSSTNHAWNSIKLDGKWYFIDSTWGDTENRNKYFLVTKDLLSSSDYGYHISDMYDSYEKANEIFATENYNQDSVSLTKYVMPSVYNVKMDILKTNKLNISEKYRFMIANVDNVSINYKSSNPKIANVTVDGVVTGVSTGKTTITAYNDDLKFMQSCVITVVK